MKKHEIKVGGVYLARVSDRLVKVQVDDILDVAEVSDIMNKSGRRRKARNSYHVTNLATGRKLTFRSAARFRSVAHVTHASQNRTAAQQPFRAGA